MTKRLYRSRTDAVLGGVCGGLAEYFDADVNLVRVIFIVFSVLTGFAVLAYLAIWLLVPEKEASDRDLPERVQAATDEMVDRVRSIGSNVSRFGRRHDRGGPFVIGFALVVLGAVFLLRNLGVAWMGWFRFGLLWPIFPILIGLAFLWRWLRGGK